MKYKEFIEGQCFWMNNNEYLIIDKGKRNVIVVKIGSKEHPGQIEIVRDGIRTLDKFESWLRPLALAKYVIDENDYPVCKKSKRKVIL